MKLIGKVLNNFNDIKNNFKVYVENDKFIAEENRYNELKEKGFVGEGKKLKEDKEVS